MRDAPDFAEALQSRPPLRERDQARECYERALAADPKYGDALFNLAMISFERGKYGKAGELWERYLAIDADGKWRGKPAAARLLPKEDAQPRPRVTKMRVRRRRPRHR